MKISIVGPTYPYKGGISQFTTKLAQSLREKHEVQLVSWKIQYPSFLYPVEQMHKASEQKIDAETRFLLNFYNPFSWVSTALAIRKFHPEEVFLTWVTPIQAPIYFVIGILLRFFSNIKIAYICHNVLPHERRRVDFLLIKLAFSVASRFIVHARSDRDILNKLEPGKPVVMAFLPLFNMFESNVEHSNSLLKKELGLREEVLLFFGYIRPYKGLRYLIQAMPNIKAEHPNASLLVVGEFWAKDKEKYLKLVRDLSLEGDVVFVSHYVRDDEVGSYFQVADLVVCPYTSATQSAIVQTAYAFNKPVISTNVGGLPDVVLEGESGYLVAPANPGALSQAVVKGLRHNWTKLPSVARKFSWHAYIEALNLRKVK